MTTPARALWGTLGRGAVGASAVLSRAQTRRCPLCAATALAAVMTKGD